MSTALRVGILSQASYEVHQFTDVVFHDVMAPDELFNAVSTRLGFRQTAELVLTIGFHMPVSRFLENFEVDIEPPGTIK